MSKGLALLIAKSMPKKGSDGSLDYTKTASGESATSNKPTPGDEDAETAMAELISAFKNDKPKSAVQAFRALLSMMDNDEEATS